jgi:nitrogen regulatory protein P-II 1
VEEEREVGGDGMQVFAISSLISHLSKYLESQSDLKQVTDILQKNGVGGITFYEINGAGRMKREAVPEMVRAYMTGRMITPEYVKRTKVEAVVPDSAVKIIVDGLNDITKGKEAHGMMFVKDVSDAYEIGTKVSGEAALSAAKT